MITKSDLATPQGSCSQANGIDANLDLCEKQLDSCGSVGSTSYIVSPNDLKLKIRKQKVMLCNGQGSSSTFKADDSERTNPAMEVTPTNGTSSPILASGSKDSGFSTPVPSTCGSSRTATPSNSDHLEAMETTESTLAAIASTPLKDPSASFGASTKPCVASNIIENEVDADKNDVFFFESDHTALKGNSDYQNLLKAVTLLESQRTQAINDLDRLIAKEKEALCDPVKFVQKLQQKSDLGIPTRLNVAAVPKVQWDQYTSNVDPLNLGKHKHMTRNKKLPKHSITKGEHSGHRVLVWKKHTEWCFRQRHASSGLPRKTIPVFDDCDVLSICAL